MEDSRLHVSLIGGFRFCKMQVQFGSFKFYIRARACVAELCLILCDPMDCVLSRLLRPWDSPGKDIGVGYHALLQGLILAQESNPHLLHWQVDSLPLSHLESPNSMCNLLNQREYPGSPVVRPLPFYCRGYQFDLWLGN